MIYKYYFLGNASVSISPIMEVETESNSVHNIAQDVTLRPSDKQSQLIANSSQVTENNYQGSINQPSSSSHNILQSNSAQLSDNFIHKQDASAARKTISRFKTAITGKNCVF